jgi:hypothetical protein
LRKQNSLPREQKYFSINSETYLVFKVWFLFRKHCFHLRETWLGNNVFCSYTCYGHNSSFL